MWWTFLVSSLKNNAFIFPEIFFNSVFYHLRCKPDDVITYLICIIQKRQYRLNEKRYSKNENAILFFLKGFQISSNYFSFHFEFRIARETAADLCALTSSKRFSRGFFSIFDLGGIKKLLMVQSVIRNNCLGNGSDVVKQCCWKRWLMSSKISAVYFLALFCCKKH